MNDRDYEEFVAGRCKSGAAIKMWPEDRHIMHMLFGVTGEVGELVDAFKKHFIYDQPLDVDHVLEELGDVEFYLAGLRNGLRSCGGMDRGQILDQNVEKLTTRYPDGYTNQAAVDRADKTT
jgi:NTP pyrophosphatase (non-canonical NTP hydrolase)